MRVNFNFELGELVIEKARMEVYRVELFGMQPQRLVSDKVGAPRVMLVMGRTMEECPGGVQYHYICRNWNGNSKDAVTVNYNEIELEKWDTAAFIKEYTAAAAEALANQKEVGPR